jgi:hypothetical protein
VVLDAPQRLEAERLGEIAETELVAVDVAVGPALALPWKMTPMPTCMRISCGRAVSAGAPVNSSMLG